MSGAERLVCRPRRHYVVEPNTDSAGKCAVAQRKPSPFSWFVSVDSESESKQFATREHFYVARIEVWPKMARFAFNLAILQFFKP